MISFWDSYFHFLNSFSFKELIKWAWFVFIFDLPRFVIVAGIVLVVSRLNRYLTKKQWIQAKEKLFLENPLITVLVPGHNEGKHIYKLIKSLEIQTYTNWELIIVDDGSTDDTPMIANSFEKQGKITKFLRCEERGGKASAANLGLRYSKGKYIVHLDADSSIEYNAIEKILIPFFRYEKLGAVGGNLVVRNGDQSLTTTMQFLEYMQSISTSRIVLSYLGVYRIVSGAFGAFPKDILMRVGGWDIGPGLDGDITVKIRKINYKIYFEEQAICKTHVPDKWKALAKQRLRWSRSLVRFRMRKHRDIWVPNKNFNFLNFLSFFENVFFSFVLDFLWIYYMINVIIFNTDFLIILLVFNYTLYFLISLVLFHFALATTRYKDQVLSKIFYVPLYPIYMGFFMRIVRSIAYIDELFFYDSYKDPWNPQKTSLKAKEFKM